MAKSTFSEIDEYGFVKPEDFDYVAYEEFLSEYLKVLIKRAKKWSDLTKRNPQFKPNSTLKRYIRKGVPSEHRCNVWLATSGANVLKEKEPTLYYDLLKAQYTKEVVDSIRIDLPRTFPDNIFFSKTEDIQEKLYRILVTFAHYNKEVGYCQGLNYIAGLLLLATKDEEKSFWLLLVLVQVILPKNYYTRNMSGLIVDINVLGELVQIKEPRISQHVKNIGLSWAVVVTKWFVCLYSEVLPTETVLRIWDCLFAEGSKILFRVALTLIRQHREEILATEDFASLITCFKNMIKDKRAFNCHEFMTDIFKQSLTSKKIEELRSTCSVDVEESNNR